jgi:phospholipid/cholesterol/gamma-HCH transport system substrate-binding protein
LNDPTSTALSALVTTLGEGEQGNGKNVAAALKALAPAMTDTGQLTDILNQQNALLNQLIDDATPSAKAVADNQGHTLDQLVSSAQQALATVSANRQAVDSALSLLPATLSKAERTFSALTGAAQATTPTLDSITPVTSNLSQISNELRQFASAANPALTALQPVLDRASALLDQAAPVVQTLQAGTPNLRLAAGQLTSLGLQVVNNVGSLIDFATGWAMCTSGYDSISHYFRGLLNIDANSLKLLAPNLLPGVGALGGTQAPPYSGTGQQAGGQSGQPSPTQSTGILQLPLSGLLNLAPPSTSAVSPSDQNTSPDNATGLTQPQEQSLLGQLLGGL